MKNDREQYEEKDRTSDIKTGVIAAGTDLLVVETDNDALLEAIEISCETPNWFKVVIREQDGSACATEKTEPKLFRHNADGLVVYKETFDDPIMSWGSDKEIVVQNVDQIGAGDRCAVNLKLWERK